MKIINSVFFLLFLHITCSQQELADHPTFSSGLLTLPVVDDGSDTWALELELLDDTFPPEFALTFSREIFARWISTLPGSRATWLSFRK